MGRRARLGTQAPWTAETTGGLTESHDATSIPFLHCTKNAHLHSFLLYPRIKAKCIAKRAMTSHEVVL